MPALKPPQSNGAARARMHDEPDCSPHRQGLRSTFQGNRACTMPVMRLARSAVVCAKHRRCLTFPSVVATSSGLRIMMASSTVRACMLNESALTECWWRLLSSASIWRSCGSSICPKGLAMTSDGRPVMCAGMP